MRTLVVGDLQGCADELEDLLAAVGFVPHQDRIVAAGDLVNRGPRSLDTLRILRDLGGDLVLGNHDLHLLAVAAGLHELTDETFTDVLAAPDLAELLDWIVDRPGPVVLVEDGWIVVHAGIPPDFALPAAALAANQTVRAIWRGPGSLLERVTALWRDPTVHFLTHARYCDPHGTMAPDTGAAPPEGFRPWFDYQGPEPRIAFGHWARLDPERARRPGLRFLDTGCVYGERLTGWLVEEDRIVSVPARRVYWQRGN